MVLSTIFSFKIIFIDHYCLSASRRRPLVQPVLAYINVPIIILFLNRCLHIVLFKPILHARCKQGFKVGNSFLNLSLLMLYLLYELGKELLEREWGKRTLH